MSLQLEHSVLHKKPEGWLHKDRNRMQSAVGAIPEGIQLIAEITLYMRMKVSAKRLSRMRKAREILAREKITAREKMSAGMRTARMMRKCGGREQELASGPGT